MDKKQAERLGKYLRRCRERTGLSARQLALRAELTNPTIIRIENGQYRSPEAESLARIANALDISVHEVFERAGYMTNEDLPAMAPYLRTKYDMPPEALEQIERYAKRVAKKHGIDIDGPKPGQDETP